ncbi:hypothetical protein JKP88DRAFT_288638 [Tribonema minus]|uniref:Uncharacterized protein n=1 Tax=Tribonema minus TaxID=303371 RepID=A0A836CIN4_9STRA|nr:hypothetical protein JKP88DRAFT_288638 [Tribonema minus]
MEEDVGEDPEMPFGGGGGKHARALAPLPPQRVDRDRFVTSLYYGHSTAEPPAPHCAFLDDLNVLQAAYFDDAAAAGVAEVIRRLAAGGLRVRPDKSLAIAMRGTVFDEAARARLRALDIPFVDATMPESSQGFTSVGDQGLPPIIEAVRRSTRALTADGGEKSRTAVAEQLPASLLRWAADTTAAASTLPTAVQAIYAATAVTETGTTEPAPHTHGIVPGAEAAAAAATVPGPQAAAAAASSTPAKTQTSAEESSCSGGQEDDDDDREAYADEICRKDCLVEDLEAASAGAVGKPTQATLIGDSRDTSRRRQQASARVLAQLRSQRASGAMAWMSVPPAANDRPGAAPMSTSSYLTGKTNASNTDGYAAGVGEDAKTRPGEAQDKAVLLDGKTKCCGPPGALNVERDLTQKDVQLAEARASQQIAESQATLQENLLRYLATDDYKPLQAALANKGQNKGQK